MPAGVSRPDLVVEDFFLRLLRLRAASTSSFSLFSRDSDDVLLVVERERVLLVAVLGQRALALLRPCSAACSSSLLEPVEHVLGRLQLDGEVLLDVLVDQRVDGLRRERRIARRERHVDEMAARDRADADAADERVDQRRFVRRLVEPSALRRDRGRGALIIARQRCASASRSDRDRRRRRRPCR